MQPVTIDVTITNADGQRYTAIAAFTVIQAPPAPLIVSVEPSSGPAAGGTLVTIRGQHFQAGATVEFGGEAATGVHVSADGTTIICVTPALG